MKKLFAILVCTVMCIAAGAQEKHPLYIPVDFGATFSTMNGIEGAFYMRSAVEYRFDYLKGPFILAELDTRTHPYTGSAITTANVSAGDAAFTDILVGPGWRFMLSEKFKIALSLQGGVTNMAYKEVVAPANHADKYVLKGHDKWSPIGKAGVMLEYYLNSVFDLFVAAGVPVTTVPLETASSDPVVLFPTVSAGFNMALF